MKRGDDETKVTKKKEAKIRWRKNGGGSLRLIIDGQYRIIKPGEQFKAKLSEIPKSFIAQLTCLETDKLLKEQNKKDAVLTKPNAANFRIVEKSAGKWFVLNTQDKEMNDEPLTEDEAKELAKSLNS